MKGAHLIPEFLATPWALDRRYLHAYAGVLARWAGGVPKAMEDGDEDYTPRKNAFEARRQAAQGRAGAGAIAVLPLYGAIFQRANMITDYSGGTSAQEFSAALRDALADETVGAILIDIDSPGGSVYGCQELFDEIYGARNAKPIAAIANSLCASAAYYIGCAASQVYVTPSGEVGSIGVWTAHEDWSKYMENAGVKTTLISAGKYKTEGNPYGPMDGDALAFMQTRIDDYYGAFTRAVAKGRAAPIDSVRGGMGQGRVLGAKDALEQKMVDGIATFGEVLKNMARQVGAPNRSGRASSLAAARREIDILG